MSSSSSASRADFRPPPGTFVGWLQDSDGSLSLALFAGDIEHPRLVGFIKSGDPDPG